MLGAVLACFEALDERGGFGAFGRQGADRWPDDHLIDEESERHQDQRQGESEVAVPDPEGSLACRGLLHAAARGWPKTSSNARRT